MVVYRDGKPINVPVRIVDVVTIRTEDIYLDTIHDRPGYELEAVIIPGDSGGVVVVDHRAVAVVWARSRRSDTRAWSVDALVVADRLAARHRSTPASARADGRSRSGRPIDLGCHTFRHPQVQQPRSRWAAGDGTSELSAAAAKLRF